MSTEDFIAACLMIPTEFIDNICDEYNVDFGDEDFFGMLDCCSGDCFHSNHYRNVGRMLVRFVLQEIVDLYTDVLDEEKFELDIDGRESGIIYDGERIKNKEQLDFIYNEELERQLKED